MEWTDDGIVLAARKHGESGLLLSLLTREHGRHAGLVKGGASRRAAGIYEPGNIVRAVWKARLEEQLGHFHCEALRSQAAGFLADAGRLAALSSACALIETAVPEREPHGGLFDSFQGLLGGLEDEAWAEIYVRWEVALLTELGFGLDLTACAATGQCDDLIYVSPKTGRAVSRAAGELWKDRLLPLPAFLAEGEGGSPLEGMILTGWFLEHHVLAPHRKALPPARARLVDRLAR
jgi:DNA repair protein RecO (recombination protein O)